MKPVAIIILVLLFAQTVDAREDPAWIGPDSVLFPLKIWVEKFKLNFVFDHDEKVQGMLDLADERLREAESMENRSEEFKRSADEYTAQIEELQDFIDKNNINDTKNIQVDIKRKLENHMNRTKTFKEMGNTNIIQRNIIEATSSSGNSKIKVSVINGNASVYTEGNNATITRDGSNVTVVSVTSNSRQQVIVKSFQNNSSSSSVVVSSSSSVVSGD
jgi:hypothetical protein